jgi:hypothetical protein
MCLLTTCCEGAVTDFLDVPSWWPPSPSRSNTPSIVYSGHSSRSARSVWFSCGEGGGGESLIERS